MTQEEIAAAPIGADAMNPNGQRSFTLPFEALRATAKGHGKGAVRH